MPGKRWVVSALLAMALVACGGGAGTSQSAETTDSAATSSPAAAAGSAAATGVCRAFLINGPVDLGRQVLAMQSSGEDTEALTREMILAYEDVASSLPATGQDVEDFRALLDTVNAGEAWEGAMNQFVESYAEACGVQIVRH